MPNVVVNALLRLHASPHNDFDRCVELVGLLQQAAQLVDGSGDILAHAVEVVLLRRLELGREALQPPLTMSLIWLTKPSQSSNWLFADSSNFLMAPSKRDATEFFPEPSAMHLLTRSCRAVLAWMNPTGDSRAPGEIPLSKMLPPPPPTFESEPRVLERVWSDATRPLRKGAELRLAARLT